MLYIRVEESQMTKVLLQPLCSMLHKNNKRHSTLEHQSTTYLSPQIILHNELFHENLHRSHNGIICHWASHQHGRVSAFSMSV